MKQDAMNLFLGVYKPLQCAWALWELESDFALHNSFITRCACSYPPLGCACPQRAVLTFSHACAAANGAGSRPVVRLVPRFHPANWWLKPLAHFERLMMDYSSGGAQQSAMTSTTGDRGLAPDLLSDDDIARVWLRNAARKRRANMRSAGSATQGGGANNAVVARRRATYQGMLSRVWPGVRSADVVNATEERRGRLRDLNRTAYR